jgi:hypothetical protein
MRNNGCEIALYNATKQIPVSPQRIGSNGNEGISVIVEYETQIGKNDGSIGEPIVWVNVGRNGLFRGALVVSTWNQFPTPKKKHSGFGRIYRSEFIGPHFAANTSCIAGNRFGKFKSDSR